MPGEGETPMVVNALAPQQGGTRVGSQIPKAAALFPALPIPALLAQNILTGCVNVWGREFEGGRRSEDQTKSWGSRGGRATGSLVFDFTLSLIDSSALQEAQQRS